LDSALEEELEQSVRQRQERQCKGRSGQRELHFERGALVGGSALAGAEFSHASSKSSSSQMRIQPKLLAGLLAQSCTSATMAELEANVKATGTEPPMMRFDWAIELE